MLFTPDSITLDGIIPPIRHAGGKGSGLYWLQVNGFRTPPTWVLSTTVFDRMVEHAGVAAAVREIDQATASTPDWESGQRMLDDVEPQRQAIVNALHESPLPEAVLALLLRLPTLDHPQWAVRSSATVEDRDAHSYAGQFLSMLSVPSDLASLTQAIRQVWASVFKREVLSYRAHSGTALPKMAVILQPMKPITAQERSGVAFSYSPVPNLPGVLIQAMFGAGRGVVEGHGGDLYAMQDVNVTERHMPPPHITISGAAGGEVRAPTPSSPVFTADEVQRLVSHVLTMAEYWGRPINVEFIWYVEQAEPLFVQIRTDTSRLTPA